MGRKHKVSVPKIIIQESSSEASSQASQLNTVQKKKQTNKNHRGQKTECKCNVKSVEEQMRPEKHDGTLRRSVLKSELSRMSRFKLPTRVFSINSVT